MMKNRIFSALLFFLSCSLIAYAGNLTPRDFDRLDGQGASGRKVELIESDRQLEIRAYPVGSLKGLALKVDRRKPDKPVLVLGYRFDTDPTKQLVRRALLGMELKEGFRAFKDPLSTDYDRIVVSNQGLASPLALFKLDPEPETLYPNDSSALAQTQADAARREPAGEELAPELDENGTITPFFANEKLFLKQERDLLRR
ncbi:MAG: hypothetical protein NDJ90_08025 [Oligoflexia bacterium]|nr:hypothetical protein [Oligoflexia bacterium]